MIKLTQRLKRPTYIALHVITAAVTILGVSGFGLAIKPALAAPASVWTTQITCADPADQDANEYANGDTVYVRGKNFETETTYYWTIMGNPGGASADPSEIVASGDVTTDGDGYFCIGAYVVGSDGDLDDGVYTVDVYDNPDHEGGSKNDNYHVNGVLFGSISGTKFYDWDRDNETDEGDQTLSGWAIKLYSSNWDLLGQTTTDGDGNYSFIDVFAGEYFVCEVVPFGWTHSFNPAGTWWTSDEYCKFVNVATNENTGGVDFHNYLIGAIHGQKFNDLNGDGEWNDDTSPLAGWTIFLDENENGQLDEGEQSTVTGSGEELGWYWFTDLEPGTYNVCEVPQNGWTQTYPDNENNNCHTVTVPEPNEGDTCFNQFQINSTEDAQSICNFGNQRQPVALTLQKMDTPDPVVAGANITYTMNFAVLNDTASNVVLTDTVPTNTTYISSSAPGAYDSGTNKVTWTFSSLAPGNYVATMTVKVNSPLANGTVIHNTATVQADRVDPVSDSEDTTVSSGPVLVLTKTVDKTDVAVGESVVFTIVIKNTGTDTAHNVKLSDVMPTGFTFDNGTNGFNQSFGDIAAGAQVSTTYTVTVDNSVAAGTYANLATVTSDNYQNLTATQNVNVHVPQVLGEEVVQPQVLGAETLPTTGASIFALLLASLVGALGLVYTGRKIFSQQS